MRWRSLTLPGSYHLQTERPLLLLGRVWPHKCPRLVKERVDEDVIIPGTLPGIARRIKESQDGDIIFVKPLAIKDLERLRLLPYSTSALELSPEASPEPAELPASTAPVRME
jgi:hypothetical protein